MVGCVGICGGLMRCTLVLRYLGTSKLTIIQIIRSRVAFEQAPSWINRFSGETRAEW